MFSTAAAARCSKRNRSTGSSDGSANRSRLADSLPVGEGVGTQFIRTGSATRRPQPARNTTGTSFKRQGQVTFGNCTFNYTVQALLQLQLQSRRRAQTDTAGVQKFGRQAAFRHKTQSADLL